MERGEEWCKCQFCEDGFVHDEDFITMEFCCREQAEHQEAIE